MIDHPDQLPPLKAFHDVAKFPAQVFVKVDTGYHRAGIAATSESMEGLMAELKSCETSNEGAELVGFYSHAGDSYGGSTQEDALKRLNEEIDSAMAAATFAYHSWCSNRRLVVSVGATPTSTSIQNVRDGLNSAATKALQAKITEAQHLFEVEVHAGVYPVLDIQQCATGARGEGLSRDDIALSIMTEVSSYYSDRPKAQALIAAGSLALGREPCKSYSGWGVVTPWGMDPETHLFDKWIIGKVSQEHGILVTDSDSETPPTPLKIGQKVRIWPNHACVAGAGYGYYLIVDSQNHEEGGDGDIVVDVWSRWRGW